MSGGTGVWPDNELTRFLRRPPRPWPKKMCVLDLGCGTGANALAFVNFYSSNAWYSGWDIDSEKIKTAEFNHRERYSTDFFCGSFEDAIDDVEGENADLIIDNFSVVYHEDPIKIWSLAYEKLAPGGILWVRMPAFESKEWGEPMPKIVKPARVLEIFKTKKIHIEAHEAGEWRGWWIWWVMKVVL